MIINQKILKTPLDVLSLDIIDFNRLNGYWKNSAECLVCLSSWLTANGAGGFLASELDIDDWNVYIRDDFPGWDHCGNHEEIGKKFWNWFMSTKIDARDKLIFSDEPDFYGRLGDNNFWGDVGKVSPSSFVFSIKSMSLGDVWISVVGDGYKHIVLESLYSPKDCIKL